MRHIIQVLFLVFISFTAESQLRLLSYNLLNFPTGNIPGRVDTLKKILNYARPHLLMIQELKNSDGLEEITDMMNDLEYGDFASCTYVDQQSPGTPSYFLQQAIVYDTQVLRLRSESVILTEIRDINEYVMYLNDPQLPAGVDTTFLYVYVTHLKSSEGNDNELARLNMVNALIDHFNEIPSNSLVVFAGDFNLYSNTEPAYTAIMNESNAIVLKDIFADYGDWPGTGFSHKEILTQSTRATQIFNDGAGGGVDDRFDFILFSEDLMNQDNTLHYAEGSYLSLGNTGQCYNQSITSCSADNEVPFGVLQAMYYMSDHLPQYCELESEIINNISRIEPEKSQITFENGNVVQDQLMFSIDGLQGRVSIQVLDIYGNALFSDDKQCNNQKMQISVQNLSSGIYILSLLDNKNRLITGKFFVQK